MSWTPAEPMISLRDVHKSFGDLKVLKGISLDVMKGDVICIIGPSGSGKSTLIRCINALNDIQKGSIKVEGQEVNDPKLDKLELRKKVGMVFQQYNLFPHKTALQNVMMAPVRVLGQDKVKAEEAARALIKKVRLEGKEDAYPGELSGGQQQRVALARALVQKPKILMLDEPLSALEEEIRYKLQQYILTVHKEFGLTTILISHDISEVLRMSDTVIELENGKIIKQGPTNQIFNYKDLSAKFQLTGTLIQIIKQDFIYILSVQIGKDLVKIVADESEGKDLMIGDKILVSAKAFNPIIQKIG